MVFIRSDKKGTRSQRIMRNIIWKSVWNYLDNMLNTTCYNYKEEGAY